MRAIMLTIFCVITVSFSVLPQITNNNTNNLIPKAYLKINGSVHWFMEPADEMKDLNTTASNIRGVISGMTVMTNESGTNTLGFRVNQVGNAVDSVYFLIPALPGFCEMSDLEFHASYTGIIDPQTSTAEINLMCASGFFPGFKFLFDFNAKTVTLTIHEISNCDSCSAVQFGFAPTDAQILNAEIPDQFYLSQNYPNPFNPTTNFEFRIASASGGGLVSLKVFDLLGNEVATLINEEKPAGSYRIQYNASSLTSGIYFYRIQAGSFTDTKKFILMK